MQSNDTELEATTLRQVAWRVIPLLFVVYIFNILNRLNVNVAILTMKGDLHLTDSAYAVGAQIFFAAYFFFQVPSNILLERVGARKWIGGCVLLWSIAACCVAFARDIVTFCIFRSLLGVAQAGFFPGIILYLTYWFPNSIRGRASARFIVAGQVAQILNNPLGALLLKLNGWLGLKGWQWLFLLEGIPTFLLGFAVLALMTNRPEEAHWLPAANREWLVERLTREREERRKHHSLTLQEVFRYPRVLHLALIFFMNLVAGAGLGLFTNAILKQRLGLDDQSVLLIGTIPTIVGALALLYFSAHSDRTGERRLYVVAGLGVAAAAVVAVGLTRSPWITLLGLAVMALGTQCANGPFWAMTSGFLTGAAAAAGIAFINSIGNLGQFFGPILTGYCNDRTGGYQTGILLVGGVWALTAVVAYLLPEDPAHGASRRAKQGT